MADLVERLRTGARTMSELNQAAHEAAGEIARLTAALAEAEAERNRLRKALMDAVLQLRYLHERGPARATTEVEIVRAEALLAALTRPAAQPEGEHD